jgi:hypothetical protein
VIILASVAVTSLIYVKDYPQIIPDKQDGPV